MKEQTAKTGDYEKFMEEQLAKDPELRAEYYKLLYEEQVAHSDALKRQFEDLLKNPSFRNVVELAPILKLLALIPSQSTTLFRNKVIQECIDKLKKDPVRTTGVTPVSEYADGFDGGFDHAIETLQTLLEKEGDL